MRVDKIIIKQGMTLEEIKKSCKLEANQMVQYKVDKLSENRSVQYRKAKVMKKYANFILLEDYLGGYKVCMPYTDIVLPA